MGFWEHFSNPGLNDETTHLFAGAADPVETVVQGARGEGCLENSGKDNCNPS